MKKNQHTQIETPSFVKTDSKNQDDYDFSDDLIDEHVVTGMMPFMMSPRQNYSQQSSRALKSIQNIQNTYLHNNMYYKHQNNVKNYNEKNYQQKANNYNYDATRYKQNKLSYNKSQSRLQQNIQQHLTRKQKKIKDLKQILQNKEMKQCTFTPKTHLKDKKDKLNKRDLEQFLKNQQEHVNKIQKKRQDIKKKVQQNKRIQESFRPKINKTHKTQSQFDKKKQPAHERLYLLKQNKVVKNFIDEKQKNMKSRPKIQNSGISINKSLTPKKSVFQQKIMAPNTLYEDAQRRQNLAKSIQKNKSQTQNFQSHYHKNKNNQKFSAQKFIKQYCYILQCLKLLPTSNISSSYTSMQADISFIQNPNENILQKQQKQKNDQILIKQFTDKQFNDILRGLGFLIYEENSQSQLAFQQKNLAYQGFQLLQQYGVNIRNLCVFLLSILGIFNVNPIKFYDNLSTEAQKNQFQITQKQGRKIHKHFDILYRNHLNSANKSKKILHSKQNYSASPYSHSPSSSQIKYISPRHNQHTKQLASKYRTKMIERANQRFMTNNIDIVLPPQDMLTHEDLLVIDNLGRNLQIKKIKQDKDNYIDKQCTFYPKTNNNHGGYSACHTDRGLQKSKQLYQHARSKQQIQKQQYQNNKYDGYQTFQLLYKRQEAKQNNDKGNQKKLLTNRNNSGNYNNKNQPSTQRYTIKNNQIQRKNTNQVVPMPIRDVDKAVARMTLGRKQRQLKNKLLQRGQPDYSQKKLMQKSCKFSPHKTHQSSAFQPPQHIYSTNNFASPDTQQPIQTDQHQQQNNQPFLVIDVNMGEQTGQIQFFTGDEKKVGTIVDQFCIEHDLDQQCKQQLLQLVQIQMTKYLNNLGAQSTEC